MNKTLKRTLAIALTLVMLTAMVPMMASGANVTAVDFTDATGIAAPVRGVPTSAWRVPVLKETDDYKIAGSGWGTKATPLSTFLPANATYWIELAVKDPLDSFTGGAITGGGGDDAAAITALTSGPNGWVAPAQVTATIVGGGADNTMMVVITYATIAEASTTNPITAGVFYSLIAQRVFAGINAPPRYDLETEKVDPPQIIDNSFFIARPETGEWVGAVTSGGKFSLPIAGSNAEYVYRLTPVNPSATNTFNASNGALIAAAIKVALDAGSLTTTNVTAVPLGDHSLRVVISYQILPATIPSITVTSDITAIPSLNDPVGSVGTPQIGEQASINRNAISRSWNTARFENTTATLTLTIPPATNYTFNGAPFLNNTSTAWRSDNATAKAIQDSFDKADSVEANGSSGSLVLTIKYPVNANSPADASALAGMLVSAPVMRIPIGSSLTITSSTANSGSSPPVVANQAFAIGAGAKTLVLRNNAVVIIDRAITGGGNINVEGQGVLEIPSSRLTNYTGKISVSGGATLRITGSTNIPAGISIDLNNGGILAPNGIRFLGPIFVPANASATINGNLTNAGTLTLSEATANWHGATKLTINGTLTVVGNVSVGGHDTWASAELHATSIIRADTGIIDVYGLLKTQNFSLGGTAATRIGDGTRDGAIVVTSSFIVDTSAVQAAGSGIQVHTTKGLLLAANLSGSGAGLFEKLEFRGNNAVDNRNVLMLEKSAGFPSTGFDTRKMNEEVFFNITEFNRITGWFRDAAGTQGIPEADKFPAAFGPLFAQWSITTPTIPAPTTPAELVEGFFEYMLGRGADADGLKYWTEEITSGRLPGRQLGVAFVTSPEFIGRNLSADEFVEALYKGILGRVSEPLGKAYWVGQLAVQSRAAVARNFANAGEFKALLEKLEIAW